TYSERPALRRMPRGGLPIVASWIEEDDALTFQRQEPQMFRRRMTVIAVGGVLATLASWASASPALAASSPLPSGPYSATLTPYVSSASGRATVSYQSGSWFGSVHLNGLTPGDHYQFETSIVEVYVNGLGVSFRSFSLCSFVATTTTGNCHAGGINI